MSVVLDASGDPPPQQAIDAAAETLAAGRLVGLPTDTVYGLAGDPRLSAAVDRLFAVKARPRTVSLPVLVASPEQALELVTGVPDGAQRVMAALWPGAITVVLPRRPAAQLDLGDDEATIGLRCPAHPVPLALCAAAGPIATTSANRHGEAPVTSAADLVTELPGVTLVLDAGRCDGEPSTVVDFTGSPPKLLRAGAVPWEVVLELAG